MTLQSFRTASLSLTVAAALACAPAAALAQAGSTSGSMPERSTAGMSGQQSTSPNSHVDDMSQPNPAGAHQWTEDQILTATVHQAWMLSGRNEQNFFEIVRQLAEISAKNRNLTLPDDPTAGKRAGEYIREQARADHDQLLYSIVDKAVQMTSTKSGASTTSSTSTH